MIEHKNMKQSMGIFAVALAILVSGCGVGDGEAVKLQSASQGTTVYTDLSPAAYFASQGIEYVSDSNAKTTVRGAFSTGCATVTYFWRNLISAGVQYRHNCKFCKDSNGYVLKTTCNNVPY